MGYSGCGLREARSQQALHGFPHMQHPEFVINVVISSALGMSALIRLT